MQEAHSAMDIDVEATGQTIVNITKANHSLVRDLVPYGFDEGRFLVMSRNEKKCRSEAARRAVARLFWQLKKL
jgi:hypothetical protein